MIYLRIDEALTASSGLQWWSVSMDAEGQSNKLVFLMPQFAAMQISRSTEKMACRYPPRILLIPSTFRTWTSDGE